MKKCTVCNNTKPLDSFFNMKTAKDGKSYRMDRLVEFNDHLAIIDYKLTIPDVGSDKYEKYRKQLQGYQAELTRIRKDKPNKAYLISSKGEIKEIH